MDYLTGGGMMMGMGLLGLLVIVVPILAAARFIATPEHEKMHDELLWDLRRNATARCPALANGKSCARSPRR